MKVKWNNKLSSQRNLPGGGPQGSSVGGLEYESQSNNNTDFLTPDDKFKFVDDLSLLEIINLVAVGLSSSYNFTQHEASDIWVDQLYLPGQNVLSQSYMDRICGWTESKKMLLNKEKSKIMIFNFTKNFQISTRLCCANCTNLTYLKRI